MHVGVAAVVSSLPDALIEHLLRDGNVVRRGDRGLEVGERRALGGQGERRRAIGQLESHVHRGGSSASPSPTSVNLLLREPSERIHARITRLPLLYM